MFYIILFLIVCLEVVVLKHIKSNKFIKSFLVSLPLILIIGLRSKNVGNDTVEYIRLFNIFNNYENFFEFTGGRYEYGFIILCRLIGLFTRNVHIAFCIFAFIIIFPLIYIIYSESDNIELSIFLIFLLGFYTFFISGIRQSISISMLFISYYCLKKDKIKYAILFIIIAILFHKTAIIGLLFLPLKYIKFSMKLSVKSIILSIILCICFPILLDILAILFPIYKNYFDGNYFNGSGLLASLINLFGIILIILSIYLSVDDKKIIKDNFDSLDNLEKWIFPIVLCIQIIALRANIFDRIVSYFTIILVIVIPSMLNKFNSKEKHIFLTIIFSFYILKFLFIINYRPEWNNILPYEFFWQEIIR